MPASRPTGTPRRTGAEQRPVAIHKFGGAALADARAILRAAEIVHAQRHSPMVVVVSALAGVTDLLTECREHLIGARAADARRVAAQVTERHRAIIGTLGDEHGAAEPDVCRAAIHDAERYAGGAEDLLAIEPAGEPPEARLDALLASGERFAARLFAAMLQRAGLAARYVDATEVIVTDGRFGAGAPDLGASSERATGVLVPLIRAHALPVVPGFFGANARGDAVVLGRGGSDLSATVLARSTGAHEVMLWKDVPGLLTADPRVVPDARVLSVASVREAAELAYYGAKVLHPRALAPLTAGMRVHIRPFADPAASGTEIAVRRTAGGPPVRALSAVAGQALVTVSGTGMLGVPGIAARAFHAMATAQISITLITQASSEQSITFAVPEGDAAHAAILLRTAFREELARREIDSVDVLGGLAIVAVVGASMVRTPGIAARIFSALADAGINVIAIAQGSSELNVSVVVDAAQAGNAQRAIHAAFQLGKVRGGNVARPASADVVLLGLGGIGRELVRHIVAGGALMRSRLRIVGVVDRSGYLFDPRGLSDRRLLDAVQAKAHGLRVAEMRGAEPADAVASVHAIAAHALSRPILADVAAGDTSAAALAAVDHGMDLVFANKVPLTLRREAVAILLDRARAMGCRVLREATVGAGLPIIDTHEKLIASGDQVLSIEGCPSGTLGFLFGAMGKGMRFSEALRAAMAAGYTEPDPRDDLSGMDVARKALILGRMLGFKGELEDIAVEPLLPEPLRDIPLAQFLSRIEECDAHWAARVDEERARNRLLRYRAIANRRAVRVGLVAVPAGSAFGSLTGTDNQFAFTTARYRRNPLIITGPGAGAAITAGGVLNDLLALCQSGRSRTSRK